MCSDGADCVSLFVSREEASQVLSRSNQRLHRLRTARLGLRADIPAGWEEIINEGQMAASWSTDAVIKSC